MKNIIKLLCVLLLVSCEKETFYIPCDNPQPTTQNPTQPNNEEFIDGCWLLKGGKMYMENLETLEVTELPHFMMGDTSSLRYGNPMYEFEVVIRNSTSWCFNLPQNIPGMGDFVLSGDSLTPYGLSVTGSNITVTEPLGGGYLLLGGSGRPILYEVVDFGENIIMVYVQESYENIDGYNCKYYSKLKFKKY